MSCDKQYVTITFTDQASTYQYLYPLCYMNRFKMLNIYSTRLGNNDIMMKKCAPASVLIDVVVCGRTTTHVTWSQIYSTTTLTQEYS